MKRSLHVLTLLAIASTSVRADDWPQWLGPRRDSVWRETGVLEKFPAGGPTVVWRVPVAGGYAGPAVADGRVFVTDYVSKEDVEVEDFDREKFSGIERVLCLDEASGRTLWKHEDPVKYGISYPAGPRCTPTVEEGRVYTLGAEGRLFCFDAKSGEVLWSRNLPREYETKTPIWGFAAHPLIDGERLICVVGGKDSQLVAFDKTTGEEAWSAITTKEPGYSPPTIIEAAGVRQLLSFHPRALAAVDPATGNTLWSVPYEATNGSAIMTPVRSKDLVFVGGYSNKNLLVRLSTDRPGAEKVWRDLPRRALSPVNVQPFVEDGVMYGFDQDGRLYAVEMETGKRMWETTEPIDGGRPLGSATAFLVKQADRFWMFNERGELLIAKLSPEGFEELDRAKLLEPTDRAFGRDVVWCPPAYANRRVYVRNGEECICVDLSAK